MRRRSSVDEAVLVARAREGDAAGFEALVRRHERAAYAVALGILADPQDAQDATQNAFLAAWRALPRFRAQSGFATWLYRIVTNHALNELRRRGRAGTPADGAVLESVASPAREGDPYQVCAAGSLLAQVRVVLAEMPEELRLCWVLREVQELRYDQIAELLGVSVDTVRGRIYRARRRLAERMAAWR